MGFTLICNNATVGWLISHTISLPSFTLSFLSFFLAGKVSGAVAVVAVALLLSLLYLTGAN